MTQKSLVLLGIGMVILFVSVWVNQVLGSNRSVVANVFAEGLALPRGYRCGSPLRHFWCRGFPTAGASDCSVDWLVRFCNSGPNRHSPRTRESTMSLTDARTGIVIPPIMAQAPERDPNTGRKIHRCRFVRVARDDARWGHPQFISSRQESHQGEW